ncbi:hypothetical protein UVI_02052630 [Ustilaginoidea virens]|uniref:Uncharacterized protein n=1 Tax=Ustilaginoidea virens TaxID=1159556 RepID=A0A1B5L5H0_USTVR|nr:hypothetical protein UVI_02052630 [Ustilaginoidea virens]
MPAVLVLAASVTADQVRGDMSGEISHEGFYGFKGRVRHYLAAAGSIGQMPVSMGLVPESSFHVRDHGLPGLSLVAVDADQGGDPQAVQLERRPPHHQLGLGKDARARQAHPVALESRLVQPGRHLEAPHAGEVQKRRGAGTGGVVQPSEVRPDALHDVRERQPRRPVGVLVRAQAREGRQDGLAEEPVVDGVGGERVAGGRRPEALAHAHRDGDGDGLRTVPPAPGVAGALHDAADVVDADGGRGFARRDEELTRRL